MEKKDVIAWLKNHKKQLIIAGVSMATVIAFVLGIKNKEKLQELLHALEVRCKEMNVPQNTSSNVVEISEILPTTEKVTRQYTPCTTCFDVNSHIRTLPEGRHHSQEKGVEALVVGIQLLPNQTIVDGYLKGAAA